MKQNTMRGLLLATAVAASVLVTTPATSTVLAADPIPDEGLPALPVAASPLVSERTEVLAAGVTGMNSQNDSFPNTNIRVAAFAEIGDTMYVGGKFTRVEIAATGERFDQPFLAAFDRTTGAWIDTFRPTVNGNVWDLTATDDGRLIVAGQFTNINGVANTSGVAMLDATTGAVDPTWRVSLTLTGSNARPLARALDIEGNKLYIGGNFTQIKGTDGITKNAGRIARATLSTGNIDGAFLPDINGIVFDVDADGDRVYAAGNFFYVNGTWSIGMGTMQASNGQLVPDLEPMVRTYTANVYNSYQQAVLSLGDEVWLTGAQHSQQVYRASDFGLLRGFVSNPWGDGQALTEMNGIVYQGSHANGDTYEYADTTSFPNLNGWTSRKPVRWMGAWDAAIGGTHDHLTWYPQIGTERGEGAWELFADSTDCLWAGGDFNRGSYDGNTPRYVGGFAKFCAADSTPPAPPSNPTAEVVSNGVNLAWEPSAGDDRGGQVRYELLKNDSVLASYISITTFRDAEGTSADRYFVRAMDYTGNRSATTQVFTATDVDTTRPSTPTDLVGVIEDNGDVTLTWTASTDNVGVTEYVLFRNSVEIGRTADTSFVVPAPDAGDHWYQVRALDAAGNEGFKNIPIKVTILGDDVTAPTTPTDLVGVIEDNGDVTLTWTASTDDIGVVDYIVYRNGVVMDTVLTPTAVVPTPAAGDHWYQVRARDAAGNESYKTPSTKITIDAGDVTAPTTPRDLVGVIEANGDVTLTWTASTDNVGVTEYIVFRNAVEIGRAADTTFTVPTPAAGNHWYQVRAADAAGNESYKTPSTMITISAGDTTAPTTPRDLVGVIEDNGDVTLTWTASTDNVGVTEYIVFRNGVEIGRAPSATFVVPTPADGDHWYQVRAVDAAGNESYKTPSTKITILGVDATPPNTPRDLVGVIEDNGDVTLTWTASTDNVGVTEYIVFRNAVEIGRAPSTTFTVPAPAAGSHWYQVRAVDAAGNESYKTPSTQIDI
jgi:hypothetical protein